MSVNEQRSTEVFSKHLRVILAYRNFSQKQLAEAVGVNPSSVSDWIRGKSIPRKKRIEQICHVLNVCEDDLFEEDEPVPVDEILAHREDLVEAATGFAAKLERETWSLDDYASHIKELLEKVSEDGWERIFEYAKMISENDDYRRYNHDNDILDDEN